MFVYGLSISGFKYSCSHLVSIEFLVNCPELCGNCVFPQKCPQKEIRWSFSILRSVALIQGDFWFHGQVSIGKNVLNCNSIFSVSWSWNLHLRPLWNLKLIDSISTWSRKFLRERFLLWKLITVKVIISSTLSFYQGQKLNFL